MTLDVARLTEIDAALSDAPADAATLVALRRLAPDMMVTRCDAVDMRDEAPFRVYGQCDLFLVDGRDHCWKITADPGAATGLVLAPKGDAR